MSEDTGPACLANALLLGVIENSDDRQHGDQHQKRSHVWPKCGELHGPPCCSRFRDIAPRNPGIIAAKTRGQARRPSRGSCGPAGLEEPLLQTQSVVSGKIAYNVGYLTRRLVLSHTLPVP